MQPIIEFEGLEFHQMNGASRYYISKCGAIYSTYKTGLLRPSPIRKGYLQTSFRMNDGTRKRLQVHRLVALQFVYNPEPNRKLYVNHIDGNKRNCAASNLQWVTAGENDRHARLTGLTMTPARRRALATCKVFCVPAPAHMTKPRRYRFAAGLPSYQN